MNNKQATLKYTTHLLAGPNNDNGVTFAQAVATLQDHIFFLKTDPNMLSFRTDTSPTSSGDGGDGTHHHPLPDDVTGISSPRCYEVVDRVPGLFAKLLPSNMATTTIYYEMTDTRDGLFVFLRAPLGVTQERRWVVEKADDDGDGDSGKVVRIVEYVTIFCNRLMYGSVKGQQDAHWREVHAQYVRKMGGEVGEQEESKA